MNNAQIKAITRTAEAIKRARTVFDAQTRRLARTYIRDIPKTNVSDMADMAEKFGEAMAKCLGCGNTVPEIVAAQHDARRIAREGISSAPAQDAATNLDTDTDSDTDLDADSDGDTDTPKPTIHASGKIRTVAEAIALESGAHLGDLVGWSLSGTHLKADVEAAADVCGILDELRLPGNTPIACYKKAISLVFNSGRRECRVEDAVIVEDNEFRLVHSIVERQLVDDAGNEVSEKDAEFATITKVGFDRGNYADGAEPKDCLKLQDPDHPAAIALKEAYEELAYTYLTGDIRSAFQFAFRNWHAVPTLPHGGLWYVPAIHAEKVRAWNAFMSELNQTTVIIPCFDTAETMESLREATRHGLEAQLKELTHQLDQYKAVGWNKIRISTLEKRVEEFDTLRNRAELYKDILGTVVDDLSSKVDIAAQVVVGSLDQKKFEEQKEKEIEAKAKEDAKAARAKIREAKKEQRRKGKEVRVGKEVRAIDMSRPPSFPFPIQY